MIATTWDGLRWTLVVPIANGARAYGKAVVLTADMLASSWWSVPPATVAEERFGSPGEHVISRKPLAQGMSIASLPCILMRATTTPLRRDLGCSVHPAIPCAL